MKMELRSSSSNLQLRRSARIQQLSVQTYQETDTCSEESYRKDGNIRKVAKTPFSLRHEQHKRENVYYSRQRQGNSSKFIKKLENLNSDQDDKRLKAGIAEPLNTSKEKGNANISDPIWKGSFSIYDRVFIKVDGLAAYKSSKARGEVLDMLKGTLPASLPSKVLSKLDVWPKSFSAFPPTDDVIDLYIFPENESDDNAFGALVDYLSKDELCLKIMLDDTAILVFSSLQLPHHYWRTRDKYYLWAVFIGKNDFFPYEEENPKSTHSVGSVVPRKSEKDVDAAVRDEGKSSLNGVREDYFVELSDQRSTEGLQPIEYSNHVEPFASSTHIPGQGIIQRANSSSVQRSERVTNSAFQAEKGKATSKLTICTSILNMAHQFDDDDDETFDEIDSVGERVGRYHVKPSLAPTLRAIINKHGDIGADCTLQCSEILTSVLEKICEVVQEFRELHLKNLKQHHMRLMQSAIVDAESVKVNVKWLRSRHNELKEAVQHVKEYWNQKHIRREKLKVIESNKRTLEFKRSELMRLQHEVESLESENASLIADTENPNVDPSRAESYRRFKRCSSLMDGLL